MRLDNVHVEPGRGRVLAEILLDDETTSGGVIVPDSLRSASQRAVVRAVGQPPHNEGDPGLRAGDEIIYNRYGIHEFQIDGRDHILVNLSDVTAYLPQTVSS